MLIPSDWAQACCSDATRSHAKVRLYSAVNILNAVRILPLAVVLSLFSKLL